MKISNHLLYPLAAILATPIVVRIFAFLSGAEWSPNYTIIPGLAVAFCGFFGSLLAAESRIKWGHTDLSKLFAKRGDKQ